jgi:XTP/dITP diphosphohydrolase
MDIVLATANPDKAIEIEAIMAQIDVKLVRGDAFAGLPEVVEDGQTLEENALKKARQIREFTGLCALADDTGLEVNALGGAPGVFSSRYAGENATYDDNNQKLLTELVDVPQAERGARFRCVVALALVEKVGDTLYTRMRAGDGTDPHLALGETGGPDALVTEGMIEGRIAFEKRGTHGFGFDPLFEAPALGKTLAELAPERKNQISHRYRALVEMRELLIRWKLAAAR